MADFKKGDLVQLKSGGPKMTVNNPMDHVSRCECQWFSGSKLQRGFFDPETLEIAKEDKKSK